ncbi:MAG: septal ring lytic transglycosylase RlpA family protein [Chitinophagaceae bacterium]|nr:septal ring lytic transglycosylase RlpA family protein [Chitinophagaceae bacterium]
MNKHLFMPILLLALLQFSVAAQKSKAKSIRTVMNQSSPPSLQYGIASFYDNKFEGRKMANGDLFSQKKLTAASNTLPLNSWVKVTNLSNKRSVVVLITDRMHHNNKRLIDLSRSAASKLAYIGKGLTRVKVENLGRVRPATARL